MMGRGMSFTINGQKFDANRIDAAPRLGTVEDWVYVNGTQMDHPPPARTPCGKRTLPAPACFHSRRPSTGVGEVVRKQEEGWSYVKSGG